MFFFRVILLGVSFVVGTTGAEVVTVDDDGPADFDSIQDAIAYASDGDEIVVAPGTYTSSGENVIDMLGKAIIVRSSDGSSVTFIDGENERRGVLCQGGENASTILDGFTIRNCAASWYDWNENGTIDFWEFFGGGMWIRSGSQPTIQECRFENNQAEYGGGVCAGDFDGIPSNAEFRDCVFLSNAVGAGVGGGLYNYGNELTLIRCRFVENQASRGGGILNWEDGDASIVECDFEFNSANTGGGVYNYLCSPTLTDCTFVGNTAVDGGGVLNANPGGSSNIPVFMRCVFRENNAISEGGGIHNFSISPQILECTISDNTAAIGGGMLSWNGSSPFLGDSLVCGNAPDQVSGSFEANDGTVIELTCGSVCIADITGDGTVNGGDLTFVLGFWGVCQDPDECPADLTGDGVVNGADVTVILGFWGQCE